LQRNAPLLLDSAAAEAGLEFQRGKEFLARLDELEKPDLDKREVFRGIFDGRYKLVRYFGLAHYNLPKSVEELLANNDVALYDLQNDPEEMNNLANPENPGYDKELLASINDKLNALIVDEIGDDQGMRERLLQDL
jgi:arylsulfatase A-like enzyme